MWCCFVFCRASLIAIKCKSSLQLSSMTEELPVTYRVTVVVIDFLLCVLAENIWERLSVGIWFSGCCAQRQRSVAAQTFSYIRDKGKNVKTVCGRAVFFSNLLRNNWSLFFLFPKRHGKIFLFWPFGSNKIWFLCPVNHQNIRVFSLASKLCPSESKSQAKKSVEILGENAYGSYLHLLLHSLVGASRNLWICSQFGSRMWCLHYKKALVVLFHAVEISSHNSPLRFIVEGRASTIHLLFGTKD